MRTGEIIGEIRQVAHGEVLSSTQVAKVEELFSSLYLASLPPPFLSSYATCLKTKAYSHIHFLSSDQTPRAQPANNTPRGT